MSGGVVLFEFRARLNASDDPPPGMNRARNVNNTTHFVRISRRIRRTENGFDSNSKPLRQCQSVLEWLPTRNVESKSV
jgi:hypothetical protein